MQIVRLCIASLGTDLSSSPSRRSSVPKRLSQKTSLPSSRSGCAQAARLYMCNRVPLVERMSIDPATSCSALRLLPRVLRESHECLLLRLNP